MRVTASTKALDWSVFNNMENGGNGGSIKSLDFILVVTGREY